MKLILHSVGAVLHGINRYLLHIVVTLLIAAVILIAVLIGTATGRQILINQAIAAVNQHTGWYIQARHVRMPRLHELHVGQLRVFAPDQAESFVYLERVQVLLPQRPWENPYAVELLQAEHAELDLAQLRRSVAALQGDTAAAAEPETALKRPGIWLYAIEFAQLRITDPQGSALQGTFSGRLEWPTAQALPSVTAQWSNQNDRLFNAQLSPTLPFDDLTANRWEVRLDINLPAGAWPHAYLNWPQDVPMVAQAYVDVDIDQGSAQIHRIALPWQNHALELTGNVAQRTEGYAFSDLRLQVDDYVSTLNGQWRGDQSALQADVHIPLTLLQPWLYGVLPNFLRAGDPVQANDLARFTLDVQPGQRWQSAGRANLHWYENTAQATWDAQGQRFRAEQLAVQLRTGGSEATAVGHWNWATQLGTLDLVSTVNQNFLSRYAVPTMVSSLALNGQVLGNGRNADGRLRLPVWSGTLAANGRWPTPTDFADLPWQARAATQLAYPVLDWQDLSLDIQAAGNTASITSHGTANLRARNTDFRWTLAEVPVDMIAGTFVTWPDTLRAQVSGTGHASGPWNDLEGDAELVGRGLWQSSPWLMRLQANEISRDRFAINRWEAQWRDSRLRASADIAPQWDSSWTTWPVQATAEQLQLSFADLASQLPAWPTQLPSGVLDTQWEIVGLLGDPTIRANATVTADYEGHPLVGELRWDDERLWSDLSWQDRALSVQGTGRPWREGQWHLTLQRLRTEDVAAWLTLPDSLNEASVQHDLHIQWTGNMQNADLSLTSQHRGRWETESVQAELTGSGRWSDYALTTWDINALDVAWGPATLQLSARNLADDLMPETLTAQMTDFPVGRFMPVPDVDARVSGRAIMSSEWPTWSGDINLRTEGQYAQQAILGSVTGSVTGNAQEVFFAQLETLDFRLGDSVNISGTGGYSPELWNLKLDWQGLSGRIPERFGLPDSLWRGNGSLTIAGAVDDPELALETQWETTLEIPAAQTGLDEQLPLSLALVIDTTDTELTGALRLNRPEKPLFAVSAAMPRLPLSERFNTPWSEWSFAGEWLADIDMSDLFFWLGLENIQLNGDLRGEGVLAGSLQAPTAEGYLAWQDGALRIPEVGAEFDRINISVAAEDLTTLNLSGNARATTGSVDVGGQLSWRDGRPHSDIRLRFDRTAIVQRSDVQGLATGNLALTGAWPDFTLSGELGLSNLNILINRLSGPSVAQLNIEGEQNGNAGTEVANAMALNIAVRTLEPASISGNGLNARLSGELRVLGTVRDYETDGAFVVESGTFNLLTRDFRLQEGEVRLVDEAIDLNLLAVYDRSGARIEARVTGNANQFQLQLSSIPVLPEDEIVAQLLFGKTIQNMTPFQAVQLASAVNQLRGGNSFDLVLVTRDSLGLDTLEFDSTGEEDDDVTVRVGKYLNNRVYVELDTELNDQSDWRGSVEVELTPNLSIETFTRSSSTFGGIELRWRRDY